ncbi:MAG: hypothetical protein ACUVTB_07140 [Candidatus Bathycorpusculaceae bacterium]
MKRQKKPKEYWEKLQKIFGRVEKIYTPVEGEEIYKIIRKRLFEKLGDTSEHRKVAEEYFNLYQKLGKTYHPNAEKLHKKK